MTWQSETGPKPRKRAFQQGGEIMNRKVLAESSYIILPISHPACFNIYMKNDKRSFVA